MSPKKVRWKQSSTHYQIFFVCQKQKFPSHTAIEYLSQGAVPGPATTSPAENSWQNRSAPPVRRSQKLEGGIGQDLLLFDQIVVADD